MSEIIGVSLEQLQAALKANPILRKDGFASVVINNQTIRGLAIPGKTYWFEYHCWESPQSADAEIWYRSHQQVEVLEVTESEVAYTTLAERCNQGEPVMYKVRFQDGLEWTVFEDELMSTKKHFCRPDPPQRKVA